MPRLNFKEISPSIHPSNDIDQFEKFSKEFVKDVLLLEVISGPSRGADGGIDICARPRASAEKWLVSCKHNAHSGKSVGIENEQNINDRLLSHGCTRFVGLYSTIASSGLEKRLQGICENNKQLSYQLFNSEDIEADLLQTVRGFRIAKRYFPNSIQNAWPQIIALENSFAISDAIYVDGKGWTIPNFWEGVEIYCPAAIDIVDMANENAMIEIHEPLFLAAWKDAVRLYPDFFAIPPTGIDSATTYKQLKPNWCCEKLDELRPNPRWTLLAIWSLYDDSRVRKILHEMGHDAAQQSLDLMSFSWLASSTKTERRDILTRLFAYSPSAM